MFKQGLLIGKQPEHATRLLNSLYLNGVANDMSETGCGKTYVAVAIASLLKRPIVIICPKTVRNKWNSLMKTWGIVPEAVMNYEKLIRGNTKWLTYDDPPKTPRIDPKTGRSMELPRFLLARLHFSANALIILDEAHRCKAFNSLSCGLMIAAKKQEYMLLNLSATLAVDPRDMKGIGYANNMIRKPYQREWKEFCIDHGAEWLGRWGAMTFDSEDPMAQAKMKQIHQSMYNVQKSASRLTRRDMAEFFPKNHVDATAYSMGDIETRKIQGVYDWLESELIRLAEHTEGYGDCILALISEARQKIELLKVPLYSELIEDGFDEGNSVVCFVCYSRTLDAITKRLQNRKDLREHLTFIRGGQKDSVREQCVADFQADRKRIMLANQRAGGIAVDFHDLNGKFPRQSILSPTFDARELMQALGRIDRVGALTPCYQMLLFVAGTIEERACRKTQGKLDNLSLLNDGDLSMGLKLFR